MSWVLCGIGIASVATGLAVRIVARGGDVPGWDLIAPTQGHFLAATLSFPEALIETVWQTRNFWLPFPAYSVPFALGPGYLTLAFPWPYWVHVVVVPCFAASLALIGVAAGLRWRDGWVPLLAWGASPMLLSYSLTGMPWGSGILPHAIALTATMAPFVSARAAWSIPLSLLAIESAWHCYDAGRSVGLVLLAAALFRGRTSTGLRAAWLLIGAWSVAETLLIHPTTNVRSFGGERLATTPEALWEGVRRLFEALVTIELDLPALLVLGIVAFVGMRRDRLLVGVLLAAQIAALLFLAIPTEGLTGDALRPRRFMIVEAYCILALACLVRDAGPRGRWALAVLLVLANLWQHYASADYIRSVRGKNFRPLPFTQSAEGIGLVSGVTTHHANRILTAVARGRHVLLVYNLGCYPENLTNPAGLIERVYLTLGHERFTNSVSVFGSSACRYSCLPIRPLNDLQGVLDEVASGALGETVVYRPTSCPPPNPKFAEAKTARESEDVYAAILNRLPLRPLPTSDDMASYELVVLTQVSRDSSVSIRGPALQ